MPADHEPPKILKEKKKTKLPPDHPFLTQTLEERRENGRKGGEVRRQQALERRAQRTRTREDALRELEPKAIQVLREHLQSDDERLRQTAAIRILEWYWGKPTTTVEKKSTEKVEFSSSVLDALQSEN